MEKSTRTFCIPSKGWAVSLLFVHTRNKEIERKGRKMTKAEKAVEMLQDKFDEIDRKLNWVGERAIGRVNEKIRDKYIEIGDSVIDAWYKDYTPKYYKRTNTLYQAYTADVGNGDTEYLSCLTFSSDWMEDTHNASTDYIYENSFVQGYHGGADIGMGVRWGIPFFNKEGEVIGFGKGGKGNLAYQTSWSPMRTIQKAVQARYNRGFKDLMEETIVELWKEAN